MTRVNREELRTALELLRPGLSAQDVTEQSTCFLFQKFKTKTGVGYRAVTYNDETAVWCKSPLQITGAVAAKPLLELLSQLRDEEIDVEVADNELRIRGKRGESGITMEAEISAPLDALERPTEWQPLPENFCEGIGIVEWCAGKNTDGDQFWVECIHIHPKYLEACNTMQAIRFRTKTPIAEAVMVKRDGLRHLVELGMVEIAETDTWIHFRNVDRLIVSCRKYEDDYRPLRDILIFEGREINLPRGLEEAARRAGIFSNENKDDPAVVVSLASGKLKILGQGSSGWYSERRKLKYTGPDLTFSIGPKMLAEVLKRGGNCILSNNLLRVDGPNWVFSTCLGMSGDDSDNGENDGDGDEGKEEE